MPAISEAGSALGSTVGSRKFLARGRREGFKVGCRIVRGERLSVFWGKGHFI